MIQDYSAEFRKKIGYQEVHTPQMNKAELFKVSGHYEKYKDSMFKVVSNYTEEEYYLEADELPPAHPDLRLADEKLPRFARAHRRFCQCSTATKNREN